MKKLINTLYVTTPEAYLALDGENVVVLRDGDVLGRHPLHNLEAIVSFNYPGASPALMGACVERGVELCFFTPTNRFLARVDGGTHGSLALRRTQFDWALDPARRLRVAQFFITGKIYNARWVVERTLRDHAERVEAEKLGMVSRRLADYARGVGTSADVDALRGLEAVAASAYFSIFDDMIIGDKASFRFEGRNRRPPLDRVNALLSFAYALLARETASALTGVGLDPYLGFMHADRAGRASLALDMMEELRAPFADRFVLSLINRRMLDPKSFTRKEDGAILMSDDLRKLFLTNWQERKKEIITHPYLGEKLSWGLVPHAQALLLSRWMRGDIDGYPPFLWK